MLHFAFAAGFLPPLDFAFAMGVLSIAITTSAYGVLLQAIIWGEKRPSPIAWLGFGLCTGVGYAVQVYEGVGAGSWTLGLTAFFCFVVGASSLLKGGRKPSLLDWIALALGLVTFVAWALCYAYRLNPLLAALLATASDLLLYIPLIRAGWSRPELDSRLGYLLNSLKFVPSLAALSPFTWTTGLYPASLMVANAGMNLYLLVRRIVTAARRGEYGELWQTLDVEFPIFTGWMYSLVYGSIFWLSGSRPTAVLCCVNLSWFVKYHVIGAFQREIKRDTEKGAGEVPGWSLEMKEDVQSSRDLSIFGAVAQYAACATTFGLTVLMWPDRFLLTGIWVPIAVAYLYLSGRDMWSSVAICRAQTTARLREYMPQKTAAALFLPVGLFTERFANSTIAIGMLVVLSVIVLVWNTVTRPHERFKNQSLRAVFRRSIVGNSQADPRTKEVFGNWLKKIE